jgi:uncharacterized LabA/DUF88 family protein
LKTVVYIDGFNLYYAIRNRNCKWLDVMALAKAILPPQYTVEITKYYTARVSGIADPDQPRRQQIYLSALKTVPGVEIYFGNFLAKTVCRPLASIPIANREVNDGSQNHIFPAGDHCVMPDPTRADSRQEVIPVGSYPLKSGKVSPHPSPIQDAVLVRVHWMEEKGSDVNIATHLVHDAWAGNFDVAAVLSNDTDLVEPIRIVSREISKQVILLCAAPRGAAYRLRAVATSVLHIHNHHLRSSLFPNVIPGTSIAKPSTW